MIQVFIFTYGAMINFLQKRVFGACQKHCKAVIDITLKDQLDLNSVDMIYLELSIGYLFIPLFF